MWQVVLPNLAVLRIAVYSENGTSLLGHRILPVECLRPGRDLLLTDMTVLIGNRQTEWDREYALKNWRKLSLVYGTQSELKDNEKYTVNWKKSQR